MINGILLILVILLLSVLILYFFLKCKTRSALIVICILGVGLRFYCVLDGRLHDWDERYHALVAKNMVEQPLKPMLFKNPVLPYDYRNWDNNHIWLHKQPLALWLMSFSIQIFGPNIFSVRLFSLIFSSFLILIIYSLGKELFNERVGLISAFLFAINGFVLEIGSGRASTDHVDVAFLFFITLAIWFSVQGVKKSSILLIVLTGITIGLAILSKWLPALIVIPIWVLLALHYKRRYSFIFKNLILISILIFLTAFPWQWYILENFPIESKYEFNFNTRHLFELLGTDESYVLYNINNLRIKFGEYLYYPMFMLCLFVFVKWKSNYKYKLLTLWVWIFLPLIFFSLAKTKMPGYILFIVPALYLTTGYVYIYHNVRYHQNNYFKWGAIFILFVLPLRYTFERIKPFEYRYLNSYDEKYDSKNIIFNDSSNIETMFFTDCYASYQNIADSMLIDSLTNLGFNVITK